MGIISNIADRVRGAFGSGMRDQAADPLPPKQRRPDLGAFGDVPVYPWSIWDVDDVAQALDLHERGQFSQSALLADYMQRDDRVESALSTRVLGVLGLPFDIDAGERKNRQKSNRAALAMQDTWVEIAPESALGEMLRWSIVEGFAIAEILWERRGNLWHPTLKPWHPQYCYFRWDTRQYVMVTADGETMITPGDGKWVVYAPQGLYRGWMTGRVRSLAKPFLLRQYALRDWGRYSEVHGMPIKLAKTPAQADATDKATWYQQLANLGSESTLLAAQNEDGSGFDLEFREPETLGWEAFKGLIAQAETAITLGILGQNLTSEVRGGSLAAAKVHESVRQDYLEADCEALATCLHEQLCRPWAQFNFGDADLAPWPRWDFIPPAGKKMAADALLVAGQAIAQWRGVMANSGVDVDVIEMAERFEVPVTTGTSDDTDDPDNDVETGIHAPVIDDDDSGSDAEQGDADAAEDGAGKNTGKPDKSKIDDEESADE